MRIGVVTLGSDDVERARDFYRALLGVDPVRDGEDVVYFRLDGAWLALYPRDALARYCGVPADGHGFDGVTLSSNLDSPAAVDEAAARAVAAGARVVRGPGAAGWGGHVAWIADPDGHLWELVFNPKLSGHPGT